KVRTKFKVAGAKKKAAAKEAAPGAPGAPGVAGAPGAAATAAAGAKGAAAPAAKGAAAPAAKAAAPAAAKKGAKKSPQGRRPSAARMSVSPDARTRAPVMEVFASIQGEGAFVGEPQVFLRLRGCPVRCRWCDTPASWRVADGDRARIAATAER